MPCEPASVLIDMCIVRREMRSIVDGEIVAVNEDGRPSFQALQHRGSRPGHRIVFYAFDVLHLNGRDLIREPLHKRRAKLAARWLLRGEEPAIRGEGSRRTNTNPAHSPRSLEQTENYSRNALPFHELAEQAVVALGWWRHSREALGQQQDQPAPTIPTAWRRKRPQAA